MNATSVEKSLMTALNRHGFKAKIVSAEHIPELLESIRENLESGKIDKAVYRNYGKCFDGSGTDIFDWTRSIIVIAAPSPMLEVKFTVDDKKQFAIIPPTYVHSADQTAKSVIETVIEANGYRFSRAALPEKLLAVRSGLARYGKNNIVYVDGMGSFVRLLAFYTDLPVINDTWRKPLVLDECARCKACIKKCPTGAIDPDDFQLRAEKCLTFHSESPGPFPDWIDESWHHCLIGCMRCQQYCPVNKDFRHWIKHYTEFSEEETAQLLSGNSENGLPDKWASKFKDSDLSSNPSILARNLKSVLHLEESKEMLI